MSFRNYDQAKLRYDEVKKSIVRGGEPEKTDAGVCRASKSRKTGEQKQKKALSAAEGSMERVLNKTEGAMYRSFPVDRSGKNYINLSREGIDSPVYGRGQAGIWGPDCRKCARNEEQEPQGQV